ncbi:hypothetical protein HY792_02095 [Candidatus Desantisbacteria bacterium]|nr:hypothetical protein [Candidatus Desantisbacteria bacterium]
MSKRFQSPFKVKTPEDAEGWEKMYPYYLLFSDDLRDFEENGFWFCDTMHHPIPLYPFDVITAESWGPSLGQYNSRIFIVPPAMGIAQRVLNGYLYISPIPVDPAEIPERINDFSQRAGYYYKNWDSLYSQWKEKVTREIENIISIDIPCLPEKEEFDVIISEAGISTGFWLIESYNRLLESMSRIWSYHFEFLNLGYVAFLDFSMFMKSAFPDITDQVITQLVAGIDVILFKPDEELKKLSMLAVSLGLQKIFIEGIDAGQIIARLKVLDNGCKWLDELEKVKDPWFYFNPGTGFYHIPCSWIDDLDVPFSGITGYIKRLEQGEKIERDTEGIRNEAERLRKGYYELLRTDEEKKVFTEKLSLAKTVFPYVEEHNFYIEHWHHTIFWNKMRQLGRVFVENHFFGDEEDIFYLNRYEISQALYDLYASWAIGSPARGPMYYPGIIAKRRKIIEALSKYQPAPALGIPPEEITEPFTIMLWGIVSEKINNWLESVSEDVRSNILKGHPASPGIVEGRARLILCIDDLKKIEDGEILVCPITTPSWTIVFSRIRAIVTNVGGSMSHAAIVCREYGLPAVVGTGFATQTIKNGQWLRVDGQKGIVEIIDN